MMATRHGLAARVRARAASRRRGRTRLALLLVAATLLLSGCVYLRLLELKKQLGKFDEFFGIQTNDGLAILCHTPVLLSDDVRWIGLKPERIKKLGLAEQWQVRWVKQLPPGIKEAIEFDITLELTFTENKLTRIAIPEKYFAMLPKRFLVGVIKSLGSGRVDKAGRRIEAAVTAAEIAAARPNLPGIDKLLGKPSEEHVEGSTTVVRYRYMPSTKEPGAGMFDMHLTFDTKSGELLKWQGLTPVGKIGFDFSAKK